MIIIGWLRTHDSPWLLGSVTRPMVSENVYDVAAGAPKHLPVSPHSEQAPGTPQREPQREPRGNAAVCLGRNRGLPS